jgi:tetratricopeptide (TPR) repeat protein
MDCLRTLSLAVGLACLGVGCTHVTDIAVTEPVDPRLIHKADENLPPRDPRPETCYKWADYTMKLAEDPACTADYKQRCYDGARKAYQQALRLDPDCLPAYEGLGRLYVTIADYPRAVETYQKALKKHDKEAQLWFGLGMCYARQKLWDPAVENLQKASELEPENRKYANSLGFCLARAGRYDESLACFRKAVGEAMAHYNLARMLEHVKEPERSREELLLALQAQPDLEPARQMLVELQGPPSAAPSRPAVALGFETIDDAASQPATGTVVLSN